MLLSCFIVYHTTCSLTEASSVDVQDAAKLRKIINHKLGATLLELFAAAVAVSNAHTAHAGAMSHAYVEGRIAHHDTLVGPQSVVFHRADHHVGGRLGVGHIARTEHVGYVSAKLHVGHKAQQRRPRLGKFLKEVCLLNQEDIMDGKKTVREVLKEADPELQIVAFKRFTLRAE